MLLVFVNYKIVAGKLLFDLRIVNRINFDSSTTETNDVALDRPGSAGGDYTLSASGSIFFDDSLDTADVDSFTDYHGEDDFVEAPLVEIHHFQGARRNHPYQYDRGGRYYNSGPPEGRPRFQRRHSFGSMSGHTLDRSMMETSLGSFFEY